MKFNTKLIHIGSEPDSITGALVTPISLATTFSQREIGDLSGKDELNSFNKGYEYQRTGNPTRGAFERAIASAENGNFGVAFSSGSAASTTVIQMLSSGDHIISIDDVYGGTQRMFRKIIEPNYKINFDFLSLKNLDEIKKKITSNTKLVWIESPTNPTLRVTDIKKISNFIKNINQDIMILVDNTFATPYFQKPLELGADIVLHSVTKYIGGHSDVVMGCLITNNKNIYNKLRFIQNSIGAVPSPFDCYMALRGLKTLHVRMDRCQENALKIAKYLENNENVDKVIYPGLESHPEYDIAKKQMSGFSGMITFYLNKSYNKDIIINFLKNLKIFTLAESLGAVESLLECPSLMTHASVPESEKKKLGISDNMIRLSVGIEDVTDLIDDLEKSFNLIS